MRAPGRLHFGGAIEELYFGPQNMCNVSRPILDLTLLAIGLTTTVILPAQGDHILHAAAELSAGDAPRGIVIGHLIDDAPTQLLDAATAASADDEIHIWKGDGKGNLTRVQSIATGLSPVAIEILDLDKNGAQDLVVANYASNTISILIGTGSGSFSTTSLAVPTRPMDLTAGDFNNDGNPDLIVASETLEHVTVLHGDGRGALSVATRSTSVGFRPTAIATGELNGDNYTDALVTTQDGKLIILLNDRTGEFTTTEIPVGSSPSDVSIGELDGRGGLDVTVANHDSGTVSILIGTGTGTFANPVTTPVGFRPRAVTTADVDGDNDADLLVANQGSDDLSILLNDGSGSFPNTSRRPAGLGEGPVAIIAADLDNDGRVDALATNEEGDSLSVMLNNPFRANRIANIELESGDLKAGTFVPSGHSWDTQPGSGAHSGYHLGVTNSGAGNPFLNAANTTIDIPPDQAYWCYADTQYLTTRSVVRASVTWGSGTVETADFYVICPETELVAFYRAAGTRKIDLGRAIAGADRIARSRFVPNGHPDYGFEIAVHSVEPPNKNQTDVVTGVTLTPGTYNNFQSRDFADSGNSWDTYPGNDPFAGYALGITQPSAGKPFLNCEDSNATLQANTDYFAYADPRFFTTRQIMRVDVEWASGKTATADFLVGCSESISIPRFTRVSGSSTIQLGRSGFVNIDRVTTNRLSSNGINDHVFTLRILDKPSTSQEPIPIANIKITSGNVSNGAFSAAGGDWDTVPGADTFTGHTIGITQPAPGRPFLNCADSRISLPQGGRFFAYLDDKLVTINSALQVEVTWVSGEHQKAVFNVGSFANAGGWVRSAVTPNSPFIVLGSAGLLGTDRVGPTSLMPNNRADRVLDLVVNSGGDYVRFGQGCLGTHGTPSLSPDPTKLPRIGAPFGIYLDNLRPNSTATMITGVRRMDLDLAFIQAPGCYLYVEPLIYLGLNTGPTGNRVPWGFPMPNSAGLVGLSFYNECYFLDPGANLLGIAASNGGWGLIGK